MTSDNYLLNEEIRYRDSRGYLRKGLPEGQKVKTKIKYIKNHKFVRKGTRSAKPVSVTEYKIKGHKRFFYGSLKKELRDIWRDKRGRLVNPNVALRANRIVVVQQSPNAPKSTWEKKKVISLRKATRTKGSVFTTVRYTVLIKGYTRQKDFQDPTTGQFFSAGSEAKDIEFYRARTYTHTSPNDIYRLVRDNEKGVLKDILHSKKKDGYVYGKDVEMEIKGIAVTDTH